MASVNYRADLVAPAHLSADWCAANYVTEILCLGGRHLGLLVVVVVVYTKTLVVLRTETVTFQQQFAID